MNINKRPDLLKVGDKVTSDFYSSESSVVRTLTNISPNKGYGSGYVASADGGEACSHCGAVNGRPINNVDAAWFISVN